MSEPRFEAKWELVTKAELERMYAPPEYEYLSGCCKDTMTTWELIGRNETQMRCNSCGAVVVRTARLTEGGPVEPLTGSRACIPNPGGGE